MKEHDFHLSFNMSVKNISCFLTMCDPALSVKMHCKLVGMSSRSMGSLLVL